MKRVKEGWTQPSLIRVDPAETAEQRIGHHRLADRLVERERGASSLWPVGQSVDKLVRTVRASQSVDRSVDRLWTGSSVDRLGRTRSCTKQLAKSASAKRASATR